MFSFYTLLIFSLVLLFPAVSHSAKNLELPWQFKVDPDSISIWSANFCPSMVDDGDIGFGCYGTENYYQCSAIERLASGTLEKNNSFGYVAYPDPSGSPILACMIIEFNATDAPTGRGGLVAKSVTSDCKDVEPDTKGTIYVFDCSSGPGGSSSSALRTLVPTSPLKNMALYSVLARLFVWMT